MLAVQNFLHFFAHKSLLDANASLNIERRVFYVSHSWSVRLNQLTRQLYRSTCESQLLCVHRSPPHRRRSWEVSHCESTLLQGGETLSLCTFEQTIQKIGFFMFYFSIIYLIFTVIFFMSFCFYRVKVKMFSIDSSTQSKICFDQVRSYNSVSSFPFVDITPLKY